MLVSIDRHILRGKGFFEDGLKEVGGVIAGSPYFGFEFMASGHKGFNTFDDDCDCRSAGNRSRHR